MAEKKDKVYVSDNAQLMKMWNYTKNGSFFPNELSTGSHIKVWWICSNGHEWESEIKNVAKGQKCPFCAGKKVLRGFNDLGTTNKELLDEWHYEKILVYLPKISVKAQIKKFGGSVNVAVSSGRPSLVVEPKDMVAARAQNAKKEI